MPDYIDIVISPVTVYVDVTPRVLIYVDVVLGGGSTVAVWGSITGTLSDQTDLQTALNAKQDTLVSGTNIKTVNGNSLPGSGNIVISGGGGLGYSLKFMAVGFNPADNTSYLWGFTQVSVPSLEASIEEALANCISVPKDGTVTAVRIVTANFSALGSNEDSVVSLNVYNASGVLQSSTVVSSVVKFGGVFSKNIFVTGLSISVTGGYSILMKIQTPTWASNPAQAWVHGEIYIE